MSEFDEAKFFSCAIELIVVGKALPFDSYFVLSILPRPTLFVRKGEIFKEDHLQRIHRLPKKRILIELADREVFENYLAENNKASGEKLAPDSPTAKANKMIVDVRFLIPFIEGSVIAFEKLCGVKIATGKPVSRNSNVHSTVPIEVASLIGMVSAGFKGSIAIGFPKDVFLRLMGAMFGTNFTELNPELEDGAGEIINFIFNHARAQLLNQGYYIERAVPTIARGKNISIANLIEPSGFSVPLTMQESRILFEVGIISAG